MSLHCVVQKETVVLSTLNSIINEISFTHLVFVDFSTRKKL